jgi:hypothetical protein
MICTYESMDCRIPGMSPGGLLICTCKSAVVVPDQRRQVLGSLGRAMPLTVLSDTISGAGGDRLREQSALRDTRFPRVAACRFARANLPG